jgi:hypothetical protein
MDEFHAKTNSQKTKCGSIHKNYKNTKLTNTLFECIYKP